MRGRMGIVIGTVAALLACNDHPGPWHEPLPSVIVAPPPGADTGIVLATVGAVPAPQIRFSAILQPDPNHVSPLLAPVTGVVVSITEARHARRGETLAIVGQGSDAAGREVPVRGAKDGTWRPRRQQRQFVWQGDTLGLLEEHGYWLAVGTVSDIDASFVHRDDPAVVRVQGERDRRDGLPARVEWVRWPVPPHYSYSVEVAVDFRAPEESISRGTFGTVIVTPSGPGDSLATVPASAVVQLPLGAAVFAPVGTGRYNVRWVVTGPVLGGKVLVREGVAVGTSVVADGLAPLVEAARDSLTTRAPRGRR